MLKFKKFQILKRGSELIKKIFKTSKVAQFFNVKPATVINWINDGKLNAYETLGGHHRIMRQDLINFVKNRNIPFPDELKTDKYKILIVDDEDSVIEGVKLKLEDMGIDLELENAHNGIEAGLKLIKFIPDLVILDINMPGADGYEICKIIKKEEVLKKTKVLIYTGYPDKGKRLLELGVADKMIGKSSREDTIEAFQKQVYGMLGVKYRKAVVKSL
jgi:excisionase family DNA binding protein